MGTPDFAVPSLQALYDNPKVCRVVAVYTQPDRPAGRGLQLKESPVKVLAQKYNSPIHQPENINKGDEPQLLASYMPDLCVVVAYAQFLGKAVLNTPRLGCINVHGSLLPKYRGAAPIQYAVLNGDTETGITIIRLVSKMDAGPILMKSSIPLPPRATSGEMFQRLSILGAGTLLETITALQNQQLTEIEQNEAEATYSPVITKEMGLIQWNTPAKQIVNKVRAFQPWPVAYAESSVGRIKIHNAFVCGDTPEQCPPNAVPGDHFIMNNDLFVKSKDDWVQLDMLQQEGKKALKAKDFLNGIKNNKVTFRFI
jgi:methionyl-tRNA formyltransferase